MSMLVGVRGQTRESEGATLREGITQQPGPFYNGNPSSIIWGNSPTAPLWRDESASPFSTSATPTFGVSKQHVQKEEKEKVGAGMVAGEGKASSKGRRHIARTQVSRNLNPNPIPSSSPSSPFAFGFPPQPPPGPASSSPSGFGQPRVPTVVASASSFVVFGAGNNYTRGASGARVDASGVVSGPIPSVQDERMEDIEDVIPAITSLSLKDQPRDLNSPAKVDDSVASSCVAEDASTPTPWANGSDGSGKLSTLNLNCSYESPIDGKDAPGVFVFGAKPPSQAAVAAPQKSSIVQAPAARSRTVKVKRSVSAAKGKGIAAGNGASSPKGLHVESSQSVSGECSLSKPTLGLGIPSVLDDQCTREESSLPGFTSSLLGPILVNEDSVLKGLHQSSPEVRGQSDSGHLINAFTEMTRGSQSSGESNGRSERTYLNEQLFKSKEFEQASTMGHSSSLPSAFSRVTNSKGRVNESCDSIQSLKSSFAGLNISGNSSKSAYGKPANFSGLKDVKSRIHPVEDPSSDFAQKLGLGSVGTLSDKEVTEDTSQVLKIFMTKTRGSSENDTFAIPNLSCHDTNTPGGKQDGDALESSSSSSTNATEFLRAAKEPADALKLSFRTFGQEQPESFTAHTHSEPFVFGALRSQPGSTGSEAPTPSTPFKFTAKVSPSSPSSTGGGCAIRSANISLSDLLGFKHKGSAAHDSSVLSRSDTDAVTSSLSSFNLGAAGVKPENFMPPTKTQTTVSTCASVANVKGDSDGDNSSYISARSHFVFSAGSGSTSSYQSTAPTASAAKSSGGIADAVAATAAESTGKGRPFTTGSSATSEFFEAQLRSQPSGIDSKSFEFRANSGGGGRAGKGNTARKKSHKTQPSAPRRQSRSSAKSSGTFVNFADILPDESGSPMDFSPQRYTPPEDAIPQMEQTSKKTSMEKEGLDGDDEWAQYSETDVAIENLRNAANDLTLGSKQGGRSTWEGIGKGEDESFWWGGKENPPGKGIGRNGKWKRAAFDENQGPLSGRDNTWAAINIDSVNEPESAASSSTPSVDSSASSSGWGHFTFTAGSSPNFSSATSLLRRHARRIQRDKPAPGFADVMKTGSSKIQEETIFSANAGVKDGVGSTAASGGTTMKRPVFAFDARGSVPRADGVGSTSPQTAGAAATEQVCERWRLRGNQAYANGDFPKAEEYYSRGASSVPPNETSQSCIRASMLCYSNRAATRMVVGRMREALADCIRAMAVDPNFLRVRLRAASCHLALGEIDLAVQAFKECIRRAKEDEQPDVKVSSEASEGLRKALQVEEYLDRASEILGSWSSGDTPTALRLLNEALLSSPHSERALELKSHALLLLRRYDEVVQLCAQSLTAAERSHPLSSSEHGTLQVWRWQVTAKAKYHLGRLEEALEILQKLDERVSNFTPDKASSSGTPNNADPLALSITSIRDLLRHKAAGNEAFQNGKHAEAVEHYSAALACNGDSRPFNAVCFCNRAAASQALGNIGDAIADCSRAIALDPKYAKAISRRATLHEKVRDYGQSCHDLQRLITLLEGQQQQARSTVSPGRGGRSTTSTQQDLRQARDRLAKAEDEMKKGHPLDHYMILGLDPSCSSNEIKKAYRKAALRHHPDKAGQFLARSEGGDDSGLWKEVGDEVRRDAERLFKLIGEANAILSDTQKRTRYDAEEEFRKLRTCASSATCGAGLSEIYRSTERGQGGVGRRPRDRWDSWNGYGHQYQRWQSGPDAAQPDTYARRGRYGSNHSSRSNGDGGRWTEYDWDDI